MFDVTVKFLCYASPQSFHDLNQVIQVHKHNHKKFNGIFRKT